MKLRKIEQINAMRLKLNAQGFIRKSQLKDYIGCGVTAANRAWDDITREIHDEGKTVSPLGVEPSRVMRYLHLTETQIEKYASRGL